MPTLPWTSYYHFTNPLCLPLSNTHIDIERNKDMLYRLTTTLTPRQFTYIGYKKSLKTHTAPRANEYTLEYYDHNIIRTNQDQFLDDDRFANPQITEKFFIKTPYVFTLNIFDRKFDHIISEALTDTQAYESFKERFQIFSLTFHFLAPHERDLHCSHDIMLRTKQTHTYTYYRFIQNHFDLHTPSRQPHHRFQFINSKYTSPFFLNFTYCIKDTNLHGILRNYDPITQMYIFCPITKTFNAEESRPFLIPHESVQPIEIPILEFIHNTKFNHKLYNLIQNTPYEFAVGTEELTTIKALQLLWPLLQTKNILSQITNNFRSHPRHLPPRFLPRRLTGKYELYILQTNLNIRNSPFFIHVFFRILAFILDHLKNSQEKIKNRKLLQNCLKPY